LGNEVQDCHHRIRGKMDERAAHHGDRQRKEGGKGIIFLFERVAASSWGEIKKKAGIGSEYEGGRRDLPFLIPLLKKETKNGGTPRVLGKKGGGGVTIACSPSLSGRRSQNRRPRMERRHSGSLLSGLPGKKGKKGRIFFIISAGRREGDRRFA